MTGGGKCGSPDASTCARYTGAGGLDVLVDEGPQPLAQRLGLGREGEVHGSAP